MQMTCVSDLLAERIYHSNSKSHFDTSPWEESQGGEEEDMKRAFKDIKHEMNPAFEKLISDSEHGRLGRRPVVRPAYAYTSQCFDKCFSPNPQKRLKAETKDE